MTPFVDIHSLPQIPRNVYHQLKTLGISIKNITNSNFLIFIVTWMSAHFGRIKCSASQGGSGASFVVPYKLRDSSKTGKRWSKHRYSLLLFCIIRGHHHFISFQKILICQTLTPKKSVLETLQSNPVENGGFCTAWWVKSHHSPTTPVFASRLCCTARCSSMEIF